MSNRRIGVFLALALALTFPQWAAGQTRAATVVVAAVDSTNDWKSTADFVCDGTADDVEINNAVWNAWVLGGGTILLSNGTFTLQNGINMRDNVRLVGSGRQATVLKIANGANVTAISNVINQNFEGDEGIEIADLTIDGNKSAQTASLLFGIKFSSVENSSISRVIVENVKGDGIRISANGTGLPPGSPSTRRNFFLTDITVRDNAAKGIDVLWGMRGVNYQNILAERNGGTGIRIDHSEGRGVNIYANDNAVIGILFRNLFSSSYSNVIATRNGGFGIYVEGFIASQGTNWRAQSNGMAYNPDSEVNNQPYDDLCLADVVVTGGYGVSSSSVLSNVLVGPEALLIVSPLERYGACIEDLSAVGVSVDLHDTQPSSGSCTCRTHPSTL